jgi:hypothetical protein
VAIWHTARQSPDDDLAARRDGYRHGAIDAIAPCFFVGLFTQPQTDIGYGFSPHFGAGSAMGLQSQDFPATQYAVESERGCLLAGIFGMTVRS